MSFSNCGTNLELIVFGLGAPVERSVVLKPGDVVAGVKLFDLLRHLVATDRDHRVQQTHVNHRSHTTNLDKKVEKFQWKVLDHIGIF